MCVCVFWLLLDVVVQIIQYMLLDGGSAVRRVVQLHRARYTMCQVVSFQYAVVQPGIGLLWTHLIWIFRLGPSSPGRTMKYSLLSPCVGAQVTAASQADR